MSNQESTEREMAGLCADCAHARRVRSDRDAVFYRCERFATDAAYPKYPRLPVLRCAGYERVALTSPSPQR